MRARPGFLPLLASTLAALGSLTQSSPAQAAHTFDLAQHMPPRMAIMYSMAWFGVPKADPQGGGADAGWGNWAQSFPACGLKNDPATCEDFPGAGKQRSIASRRRPQAGIYSGTGETDESRRRVDLMLSTLRRPCDSGAQLDAWTPQLDSVKFTSAHPANKLAPTWEIAYRTQVAFLDRADAAGLKGVVGVGSDSTTYWHFGDTYGLSTPETRIAALTDDIVDMAKLALDHPSALRVDGRPLLIFYVDAALLSPDAWSALLDDARQKSGVDFYTLGSTLKGEFFSAFDALVPWVNLGIWGAAKGDTLHDRAYAWAKQSHAQLVAALPQYPGRAMFGMITPGFDDYTEDWGACQARELPRDPAVLDAQFDYLADEKKAGVDVRGLFLQTWDDWTEGSEFEPDVTEGASKLVQARGRIGQLFGEPADPAGDAALSDRWAHFGQARNCCLAGGACPADPPPVDLACPAAGGQGGQGGTSTAGGSGSPAAGAGGKGGSNSGGAAAGAGGKGTAGSGGAASGGKGDASGGATSGSGGATSGGTAGMLSGGKGGSTVAGGSGGAGAGGAAEGPGGASGGEAADTGSSGGCAVGAGPATGGWALLAACAAWVRRRRRS